MNKELNYALDTVIIIITYNTDNKRQNIVFYLIKLIILRKQKPNVLNY